MTKPQAVGEDGQMKPTVDTGSAADREGSQKDDDPEPPALMLSPERCSAIAREVLRAPLTTGGTSYVRAGFCEGVLTERRRVADAPNQAAATGERCPNKPTGLAVESPHTPQLCDADYDGDRCQLPKGHPLPHKTTVHLHDAPTQDPPGPSALYAAAPAAQPVALTFDALRAANLARLPQFKNKHGALAHSKADGSDWSPAQWLQAVVGELGEYANLRKKFDRGDVGAAEFAREAADELADVVTYLDILAFQLGVDLGRSTADKFNRVSERVGCDVRLYAAAPSASDLPAPARSLLRPAITGPGQLGPCHCPPDVCQAPVIQGRQTPCLRNVKPRWADNYDFDKSDPATHLFVACSNWMDRAERAEEALRAADAMREHCTFAWGVEWMDAYDRARATTKEK